MLNQKVTLFTTIVLTILAISALAQEPAEIQIGDPAPTFYLRSLEGENFFLSKEIQEDSPIVLAFYATWCIPCRTEIPALEKMMQDPNLEKVRLYYVNVGGLMAADEGGDVVKQREDETRIRAHQARFGMTHTILLDRYAMTAQKYGATSLPTTVVIGGNGIVKYLHHGYQAGDETELAKILKELVK